MKSAFGFGESAPGCDIPVLNERETRARTARAPGALRFATALPEVYMWKLLNTRRVLALALAGCALLAHPAAAMDTPAGRLASVDWLSRNLGAPEIVLLDASPGQVYAARHIRGAVTADFLTYGFPERPPADAERRYQSWGVSPGKKIVIYDQGGTFLATRLFFALYYHGYPAEDLFVLDGGLAKWQERGLPVSQEATPIPARGTFRITTLREDARVRLPAFLTASGDLAHNVLLEALGPDWHYGEMAFFGRAGHVPNAVMVPGADFFNADKTFKSPEDLRKILAHLGIGPERRIHSHCGGGVAASVPFFALKFLLDYPQVTLFQESLMGWVSDPRDLPLWTYDAPMMMRDSSWLQAWGGQRLRSFGVSRVSIVDVRPAAAFEQGHVPFALNVPGDVFRQHVASPGALTEVLGSAGVDAAYEAVVVSGAGLTKEAALAFVMLEKLGQQKVSVLVDSVEGWARHGYPVTKEPTVVGTAASPGTFAVPAPASAAHAVEGVVIEDAKATTSAFPKIFVASGERVPARAPQGTVVHVPYTALLEADGMPKAAHEIWKILSAAGVSRYAEVICYSEDPAEAAADYFVLKLMGFPDVKVLVM